MNKYCENLSKEMQNFFKQLNFEPTSDYDANAFIYSYYNLTSNKKVVAKISKPILCEKKYIDQIVITQNNFLDAFYPKIWSELNAEAKFTAIYNLYHFLTKTYLKTDASNTLIFSPTTNCSGLSRNVKGQFQTILSLEKLLADDANPIDCLNTIIHELYHVKQNYNLAKIKKQLLLQKQQGKFLDINKINKYYFEMVSWYTGSTWDSYNDEIDDEHLRKILLNNATKTKNPQSNIDYLNYWFQISKTSSWYDLLGLVYYNSVKESGAFNKAYKLQMSIVNYLKSRFGDDLKNAISDISTQNAKQNTLHIIEKLKNDGYKISLKDVEELKKLNTMLTSKIQYADNGKGAQVPVFEFNYIEEIDFFDSTAWECIKYLLDVHKNKKFTKKIDIKKINQLKKEKSKILSEQPEILTYSRLFDLE